MGPGEAGGGARSQTEHVATLVGRRDEQIAGAESSNASTRVSKLESGGGNNVPNRVSAGCELSTAKESGPALLKKTVELFVNLEESPCRVSAPKVLTLGLRRYCRAVDDSYYFSAHDVTEHKREARRALLDFTGITPNWLWRLLSEMEGKETLEQRAEIRRLNMIAVCIIISSTSASISALRSSASAKKPPTWGATASIRSC